MPSGCDTNQWTQWGFHWLSHLSTTNHPPQPLTHNPAPTSPTRQQGSAQTSQNTTTNNNLAQLLTNPTNIQATCNIDQNHTPTPVTWHQPPTQPQPNTAFTIVTTAPTTYQTQTHLLTWNQDQGRTATLTHGVTDYSNPNHQTQSRSACKTLVAGPKPASTKK